MLQEMSLFDQEIRKLGIQYIIVFMDERNSPRYTIFLDSMVEQKYLDIFQNN